MGRVHNFNPGPSALPLAVLEKVQAELLDYPGTGMSVMEMSHRSKDFEAILQDSKKLMMEVLNIPSNYKIIYCTGGASTQFALIPMNFLHEGSADYVETGEWAEKAIKEAKIQGKKFNIAASTKEADGVYRRIPKQHELKLDPNARYVHITTNNTIFGTQYKYLPDTGKVPLICDMSSDIMSKKIDFSKNIGMIYAGAQKNMGPSGVTVVIIREDLLENLAPGLPTMFSYKTYVDNDSLYNTPPTFAIYIVKLVLEWTKSIGGLAQIEKWNDEKANLLYATIDKYPDFYKGTTEIESRSWMNVTWRLPNETMEEKFVSEAKKAQLIGLKGHRKVGGIRASLYNAVTVDSVKALCQFMDDFYAKNK